MLTKLKVIFAGFMEATVSTLMFWTEELSREEVLALNGFFESVTNVSEEEPILTLPHLRLMAPFREKVCFQEAIRLSDIYSPDSMRSAINWINCDNILDASPRRPSELIRPEP